MTMHRKSPPPPGEKKGGGGGGSLAINRDETEDANRKTLSVL